MEVKLLGEPYPGRRELFCVAQEVSEPQKIQEIGQLINQYWQNNTHIYISSVYGRANSEGVYQFIIYPHSFRISERALANAKQFVEKVFAEVLR